MQRIAKEPPVDSVDDAAARAAGGIGRPGLSSAVHAQVRAWLTEDAGIPHGEIQRRLLEAETPRGLSTIYRLLGTVRPTMPTEIMVRLEGVVGEFAQCDFGLDPISWTPDSP